MAVISTKAVVSGAATRTLGTLGRSIFNSTLGTFVDGNTMDQIYGAINKLSSPIETLYKDNDFEALNGRNKPEDLFALLVGLDIKSSSDFMNKNIHFMKRLMRLNKQERDITLEALGANISGYSDTIKNDKLNDYNHTKDNNYVNEYVSVLPQNQLVGDETTTLQLESSTNFNYAGNHNDLYVVSENLYPDDDNQGDFANKWVVENRNSLLYKTKKLFNSRKIGTIISRFHTDPTRRPSLLDNAKSKYGLSHGRNLLTKKAEDGFSSTYANGYDNPYCRVWTHHHQYDRLYKTIRPFSHVDDRWNYTDSISVKEFHTMEQFSDDKDQNKDTKGKWGWKKESNNGWDYSVLQDNGLVNITPKYDGGGAKNIHTKQCMFSIENLAWRGYDPYSFEEALSWEQRGPLGGRIMWFPPYGIQFSETTTVHWQNNTFLGRGEDVYTYANTTRTGQLSFMMVVDHPSIVDYVTWTQENSNVTDTDILRFFAGCGEGDGKGLRDYAKPTPLTDEYKAGKVEEKEGEKKEEEIWEQKERAIPKEEPNNPKSICFYVFYPNNYSGAYDNPSGRYVKYSEGSKVHGIPYLLIGSGAQKMTNAGYNTPFEGDIELNEDERTWSNPGTGYEMGKNGLGKTNFIVGTSNYPNWKGKKEARFWSGLGVGDSDRNKPYTPNSNTPKKWYYRIDGRYKYPVNTEEEKINYYNQTLKPDSYNDNNSNGLNLSISSLSSTMSGDMEKRDDGYFLKDSTYTDCEVYTLAEMAYAVYQNNENKQGAIKGITEDARITRLLNLLKDDKIKNRIDKIEAGGYASSHGYVDLNNELYYNRAESASHWFCRNIGMDVSSVNIVQISGRIGDKEDGDVQNGVHIEGDENAKNGKKWRYARVIISFKEEETKNATEFNNTEEDTEGGRKVVGTHTVYVGYNPTGQKGMYKGRMCEIYKSEGNDKLWYKINENKYVSVEYAAEEDDKAVERFGGENGDRNSLRYDQEYHFFKVLKQTDPLVFNSLMDKLQYFDPAFHSMTPEGFNGRLTFLQQCTRQGNTVSASDGKFAKSANNLAFGRAPYCVLRLGDFYNQMIVIDNISVNYDPLQWDLNVEGVGVQPLLAHINMSFKFVGGGDMSGPVRRLQNAMSFNYYANARLYDNRADRIERRWSNKTCGAIEHDEILDDNDSELKKKVYGKKDAGGNDVVSSFYTTKMYQ